MEIAGPALFESVPYDRQCSFRRFELDKIRQRSDRLRISTGLHQC
jgi:hypothetical protein